MVQLRVESIAQEAMDLNLAKAGYTAFYVDGTNGLNTYPGDSWEQPFKTIQHAVDECESWAKIFVRSKPDSKLSANAASGQKNITVVDGTLFSAGDTVIVREDDYTERATIASIVANVLTMVSNLTNAYTTADNGIVIGSYDETVNINKHGIRLIGEDEETTIIAPATSRAVYAAASINDVQVYHIGAVAFEHGNATIALYGDDAICKDCIVDTSGLWTVYGCGAYGNRIIVENIRNATPAIFAGIHSEGSGNEISKCDINGAVHGIYLGGLFASTSHAKIHDNDFIGCQIGIHAAASANNNTLYHNNIEGSTTSQLSFTTAGAGNKLIENYYDNHTIDSNNDGLTDTPYTEGGATDYQPVSRRNGWKQESLGNDVAASANQSVPAADSTANILMRDAVGNKTDTPVTTSGTTKSIMAYIKGAITELAEILDLTDTHADIAVSAETNLYIDDAPTKIINGLSIKIDTTDMGAADTYEFKIYYRVESAGSYIQQDPTITYTGAQSAPLKVLGLEPYRYGCKVTGTKTGGTNRSFPIEAIYEA